MFKSPILAFFLWVGFDFWAFAFFSAPLRVAKPCFLPLFSIISKTLQQEVPAWNEAVFAHLCIQKSAPSARNARPTCWRFKSLTCYLVSSALEPAKTWSKVWKSGAFGAPSGFFCGFCCALRKPAGMHERIGLAILKRFLFRRFSEKRQIVLSPSYTNSENWPILWIHRAPDLPLWIHCFPNLFPCVCDMFHTCELTGCGGKIFQLNLEIVWHHIDALCCSWHAIEPGWAKTCPDKWVSHFGDWRRKGFQNIVWLVCWMDWNPVNLQQPASIRSVEFGGLWSRIHLSGDFRPRILMWHRTPGVSSHSRGPHRTPHTSSQIFVLHKSHRIPEKPSHTTKKHFFLNEPEYRFF